MAALGRPKRFGRSLKLDDAQRAELIRTLKSGALTAGFGSELCTLPRAPKKPDDATFLAKLEAGGHPIARQPLQRVHMGL